MPVPILGEMLSSRDLSELVAYDQITVPTAVKTEYYFALIAWILCEQNRDRKKHPKAFELKDFLLKPKRKRKKPMTDDEMFNVLSALCGVISADNSETQRAT